METTILIGGDTCPIGRNQTLFERGSARALLSDLQSEFESADLAIVNLECPLIQHKSPIKKIGPNLHSSLDSVRGLKAIGVDVVGLANNHIMDHGAEGLRTTIHALEGAGIDYVGAGDNLAAAGRICVREVGGVRVGIAAVAEHEFSIAGKDTPGACPLDVIQYMRNTREYSLAFDKLIVLVHGGNECYSFPRPGLRDICRFFVDQGADAVICQHSHCVGCMETYQGAPIVYGQGNLIFDLPNVSAAGWHEGMLVALKPREGTGFSIHTIPFIQSKEESGARRLTSQQEASFRRDFEDRSARILEDGFVEKQWEAFCRQCMPRYLGALRGGHSIFRRVANKLHLPLIREPREAQRIRLGMIRCESHREVLTSILSLIAE